jgi:hypothetical protein
MRDALHMLGGPIVFVCAVLAVRHWIGGGMIKDFTDMTAAQRTHFAMMLVYILTGFAIGMLLKAA